MNEREQCSAAGTGQGGTGPAQVAEEPGRGCWQSGIPAVLSLLQVSQFHPPRGIELYPQLPLCIRNTYRNWPHRCSKMKCWRPSIGPHTQRRMHSPGFTDGHTAWPGRHASCAKGGDKGGEGCPSGTGCSHFFGAEWALISRSWYWELGSGPS